MTAAPTPAPTPAPDPEAAGCACGAPAPVPTAQRGKRLLQLDRAQDAGQVTAVEAAARRAELLAR